MRNSRGVARKHPTSVIADRKGRSGSSLTDQSYFRTYSSRSGPFSSQLRNSIDPSLQQKLISFDKLTEELFIRFTQKQREELNAFDRKWISEYGYQLEATSHYLDIRNVEAREETQRQNEYLIRSRSRALNSFKRRQKQELQEFYNQRMRERSEIIESSEIEPSDTVMSIVRNRSGFQVYPRTKNFSQSNSQISTKSRPIKVDIKKKNSKPSFIFSKTKFEDKDITIGRFKPKKKPKKEEDPNLLDIDNLTRILNQQDGKLQRIKKEKELDETCKIHEFGELITPSGMSSAYVSAAGSDSDDEISVQSSRTNGSFNISTSIYEKQIERFMRQEEKTNNEINEFIERQDVLIQMRMQKNHGKENQLLTEINNDDNSIPPQQNINQKFKINNNNNDQNDDEYNVSDTDTEDDDEDDDTQVYNDKPILKDIDTKNVIFQNDKEVNNYDKPNATNTNRNELSELTKSLKPLMDVEVNIFTKGLSSTSYSDEGEEQHVMIKYPTSEPENSSRINNNNSNVNTNELKYRKTENASRITVSKKSRTMGSIPSCASPSFANKSKKNLSHTLKSDNRIKLEDGESFSSGKIKIHKSSKANEASIKFNSTKGRSQKFSNNLSNSNFNTPQGKQQFAFRTTLEMGVSSFSTSPIKLDKKINDD